jgi:hypothetical protein
VGLEGTLRVFSLTDIFQMLGLQRKTGVLTVEGEDDTVTISFLGGQVVAGGIGDAAPREPPRQPPPAGGLRHAGAARPRSRHAAGDPAAAWASCSCASGSSTRRSCARACGSRSRASSTARSAGTTASSGSARRAWSTTTRTTWRRSPPDTVLMEAAQMVDEWPLLEKKIGSLSVRLPPRAGRREPQARARR